LSIREMLRTVEPGGGRKGDEELRAVGVGARVGLCVCVFCVCVYVYFESVCTCVLLFERVYRDVHRAIGYVPRPINPPVQPASTQRRNTRTMERMPAPVCFSSRVISSSNLPLSLLFFCVSLLVPVWCVRVRVETRCAATQSKYTAESRNLCRAVVPY
jgi:hypothetical protein